MAVLAGTFIALGGIIISYYAAASIFLLMSAMLLTLGVSRFYQPELLDRLLGAGVITQELAVRLRPS